MSKKYNKVYFWKGISVDSIPVINSRLNAAAVRMEVSNLKLLGQPTMTNETFVGSRLGTEKIAR